MNAKRRHIATAVASLLMATSGLHGEFVGRPPGGGTRPTQRPMPGGGMNQGQRPTLNGGLMPTQNQTARPANFPAAPGNSRPSSLNLGAMRPATLPNSQQPSISRPAVSRPSTLPSVQPTIANRPSVNLPIANRPNVNLPNVNPPSGGLKPAIRPLPPLPGTPPQPSVTRPITTLPSTRPAPLPDTRPTRPSLPDLGGGTGIRPPAVTLPARPGPGRPSPGDVGDFLGLQRPVTLPAVIDKRPGGGNPPAVTLPARPGLDNRPNWPKPGDINIGNKVINN